jgi:hypothetical protein
MREDLTKEEVIELILSDLNLEGWKGAVCYGCKPKNDAPFPATLNIESYVNTWACPRCGFVNIFTWRKQLPIFLYPDFGVLGSVIIKAYETTEMSKKDLTLVLECGTIEI